MRNISFSMTEPQFIDGSKTVTRRLGWKYLKVGTKLRAVRKAMGLKKGEKVRVLGVIEVVAVRRESLTCMTDDDCAREGFPELDAREFVTMFCKHMRCEPLTEVTRIEFRHVDDASSPLAAEVTGG